MLDNIDMDHNSDKAFAKASWKNMTAMLDQEMPVQKKESNKLAALLGGLLFLSLITIGILIHVNLNQPKYAEVTKEEIRYKNVYIQVESPNASTQVVTPRSATSTLANSFSAASISNVTSSKAVLSSSSNYSTETNNNTTANIASVNVSTISNSRSIKNQVSTLSTIGISPFQNTDYIASLDPVSLELEANNSAPLYNGLLDFSFFKMKKGKRKLRYNVGLITTIANNFDFSGYGFSAGIEFPLSKKIGIAVGLAHNELSREFLVFPFFKQESEFITHTPQKPLQRHEISEQVFYSSLKNMKQLLIPIKVSYNINDYLALTSGLNLRYTYNRIIDNPTNAENNRAIRSVKQSQLEKRSTPPTYFVDSTLGLTAGLKVKVTNNFSLGLDSEWGVNSMFDKQAFEINSDNRLYKLNVLSLSTNFSF